MARRHAARSVTTTDVQDGTTGGEVTKNENAATAGTARAREVFETAVTAAPYCLELWEAFVGDVMEGSAGGKEKGIGDVDDIRRCRGSPRRFLSHESGTDFYMAQNITLLANQVGCQEGWIR